jgi:alcohol dehydrogenase class IV
MVSEFKIARIPIIHFGPGKIQLLPALLKQYNGRVLIIISKSLALISSQIRQFESELVKSLINFEFIYSHGEPTVISVDEIVNSFRNRNISVVCAIGGGSVIDTGKAISAMFGETDSIEAYLEGVGSKVVSGSRLPFIAVPTTAGTGSEATKNAVISKIGNSGYKRSLRHENYVPDIALIDPELSLSCPSDITAASGMDACTQLMESFLSTNSNPFTDTLAIRGLEAIRDSLLPAFFDGSKLKARSDMSFAAMLSGITLTNAGLGVVHGFASSIGGNFDIPHGVICGTLLAEVHKANVYRLMEQNSNKDQIDKIVLLANLFFPDAELSNLDLIIKFSDLLTQWTNTLQIPRLGKYGVSKADVEQIIKITDLKNNPVKLSDSALKEILLNRI